MALFNRYGMDMHYSIGRSVGKALEPQDKVTLIKDTLTSGNTLKANLQAHTEKCVTDVIVSVDRMEKSAISSLSARKEIERRYGVHIHAIVTLADIIRAIENGIVGNLEYIAPLKRYKEQHGGE